VAAGEMRTMCAPCLYSISLSASALSPVSAIGLQKRPRPRLTRSKGFTSPLISLGRAHPRRTEKKQRGLFSDFSVFCCRLVAVVQNQCPLVTPLPGSS
jgi:hypothetical protein